MGIGRMVGIEYERNSCSVAHAVALLQFVEYTSTSDVLFWLRSDVVLEWVLDCIILFISFSFLNHHFYFPAQLVGGFTLTTFWTSRGHRCRPFSPVRAFIFYRA